jgi:CRP-like cAMP-binding protein
MVDLLVQARAFRSLSADALERLAELGRQRGFAPGSVLPRQGDSGDCLHVPVAGQVRVERERRGDPAPVVLGVLGPGEVVGERGVLNDAPRSATVIAEAPSETLVLDLPALAAAIVEYPTIAAAPLRMLSRRLRDANNPADVEARRRRRDGRAAVDRDEVARLEGVRLAARTVEHHVNNQLGLTVGFTDLLARHPDLPTELREWARLARSGAESAAALVQTLGRVQRLRELPAPGGSILDLDRSVEPEPPSPSRARGAAAAARAPVGSARGTAVVMDSSPPAAPGRRTRPGPRSRGST